MIEGTDRDLFEESLRRAVEGRSGEALDPALDELGWRDALDADPRTAVSLLFELQGSASATSSALDLALLHSLGADDADVAVVLPAVGRWSPPGSLRGERLTIEGLGTAALAEREHALVVATVPATHDAGGGEVVLRVPTASLGRRAITGMDPWLGLVEVAATDIEVDAAPLPLRASTWTHAVARAQLAIGHELVGASRAMLALAREHALERIQFGQPIAMFQAVRHRLAETLVAVETADAMLDAAWLDGRADTAAMAKALAGRGARTAARHCQQVLAGIGFTTEHDLHRCIRRVLVLDELFGASRTLTRQLGDDLLTNRQLPPLLPL